MDPHPDRWIANPYVDLRPDIDHWTWQIKTWDGVCVLLSGKAKTKKEAFQLAHLARVWFLDLDDEG